MESKHVNTTQKGVCWIGWKAPEEGWVKLNTDGASKGEGFSDCGGIIRDHHGNQCGGFAKFVGTHRSGVLEGLKFTGRKGYRKVEVNINSISIASKDGHEWEETTAAKQMTNQRSTMEDRKHAMEETVDSSVPLIISDSKLLDCCICSQPLSIPIFQCDNGHIICSTCCPKLKNKCQKCSLRISSKRCKVVENLLSSIEMPCRNAKHGCTEKISYIGDREHEEECIHEPCYCPFSGCDFVASSEVLSNHLSHKHVDSPIEFCYGNSFTVSLKSNDETIVLQEENDDKLFILNNSTTILGNAVNICCIGPNSSPENNYDILHKSHICKLILHSSVKNVQRVTLATLSSEFLVIPACSSEPLKLEICIIPMMQIYIMDQSGKRIPVRVNSSDTIVSVKLKLRDTIGIPVHQQSLIFQCKSLNDRMTVADYNIDEKSTIHFMLRLTGN